MAKESSTAANENRLWEVWKKSSPPPLKLVKMFQRAMKFLELENIPFEVRVIDRDLKDRYMDAATNSSYGNYVFFLVCRSNIKEATCYSPEPGRFLAQQVMHEVLHVFQWGSDYIQEAGERGLLGQALETARHAQLDTLARILVPHVFKDWDFKEDLFHDEETDGGSTDTKPARSPRRKRGGSSSG